MKPPRLDLQKMKSAGLSLKGMTLDTHGANTEIFIVSKLVRKTVQLLADHEVKWSETSVATHDHEYRLYRISSKNELNSCWEKYQELQI